ncbi:ubiquitin carboxyl-terminal hydrolase 1 [Schistocerca americana]|uniref:ubiquitin carboxyl-terminal hydrolase 1 n=1 Tax=Schistocerca americana TaxID=7009 RepID=UPI001F4F215D|nr:ubiquitin carboxyl-terminal hydrolase 1 [Schistocerca americana]XP_049946244.1 ubiquitin carboxyl-terminal hydrolase 1 [Schistocerca serialis cubense]
MTVLSGENVLGEGNSTPPRKKFRLSMKTPGYQENRQTHVARRNPFAAHQSQQSSVLTPRNTNSDSKFGQSSSSRERLDSGTMLNGYLPGDSKSSPEGSDGSCSSPVATLANLGNTCFLNSVLYTLRFAPSFLHNLHHLALDLQQHSSSLKVKSSSLGRNVGLGGLGVGGSGKSWSSKDLPSLGGGSGGGVGSSALSSGSANCAPFGVGPADGRSRLRAVTERLHDLYCSMRQAEQRDGPEPFQPDVFLHALREVNPIFEGNQQHDAHELLVCLLDTVRETCRLLALPAPASKSSWGVRKSWKKKRPQPPQQQQGKATSGSVSALRGSSPSPVPENSAAEAVNGVASLAGISECVDGEGCESSSTASQRDASGDEASTAASSQCSDLKQQQQHQRSTPGYNFVADDFEGITVLRTTCLECETVTERKETFCDICVPIATDQDSDDESCPGTAGVYQSAVVTSEHLRDLNKYWCEQCLRYNEARRQVRYERLPRLLVLQLKRFSSTFGSMVCVSKVNDYMPTPLTLGCFCETCCPLAEENRPHSYRLFGVIMHLGATIASGHYVAYVRAADPSPDYRRCDRRRAASLDGCLSSSGSGSTGSTSSSSSGEKMGSILKFFRPRSSASVAVSSSSASGHGPTVGDTGSAGGPCRGTECCGVRLQLPAPVGDTTAVPDAPWLECDDETVRVLTRKEFEDVLGPKQSKTSSLTPYLLFYVRV